MDGLTGIHREIGKIRETDGLKAIQKVEIRKLGRHIIQCLRPERFTLFLHSLISLIL
jgi:hypothetical protein